jgi:hypothetical protein
VGCGQDHIVVIAVVVRGHIDLLNPGDLVWSVLFGESRDATVGELLDPMGQLPHPVLDGDSEAGASSVAVENIPFGAFFCGKGGAIVDETRLEEFELFSLGVPLPGPLFSVCPMLALTLFKGADEAACNVSNRVKVVGDLDGSGGSAGRIDRP